MVSTEEQAATSADEVFTKVREIITENLGVETSEVSLDTHFRKDLGADSLDLAELIMDFEDKFTVGDISEDDAAKIQTVGDAVNYLKDAQASS